MVSLINTGSSWVLEGFMGKVHTAGFKFEGEKKW